MLAALALSACVHAAGKQASPESDAISASWYAGGAACDGRPDFQVRALNPDFFIMRQAACTNYEKPFLYVIFGRDRVLLLDTGAGHANVATPIDTLIRTWLARTGRSSIELVVAHSHAHGDHVAGDSQFVRRANSVIVGKDSAAVRTFFGLQHWPLQAGTYDLGDRVLDIIPIPGHQPASIAVYDRRTKILLTGDTFYPGRLYVRDTAAYASSISRLADFVRHHEVRHMLGAHVEQSRTPFTDYPVGTKDQPAEHGLDLRASQLFELDSVVQAMRGRFQRTALRDLTVWPQ